MGKITNVLNKVQKSRQDQQDQEISAPFYVNDGWKSYSKKVVVVIAAIIATGAIPAVYISNEIYNLGKSVKMQEKRFNDLSIFLSNTKSLSDNQIQDINFRLMNEAEDRKIQINKLALIDKSYYFNLIKSINANTLQINYLDKYAENLENKLEKIPASSPENKDLSNPRQ